MDAWKFLGYIMWDLVGEAWLIVPPFPFPSPPLPFPLPLPSPSPSLLLPFTHLQPDRLRSLRLNCYGNILLVKTLLPEGLQTYSPSGAVTAHQRTCVTNNIWTPVDPRKTTETETHSELATVHACTVPGRSIPGKIVRQPIKFELHPQAHAYPAIYVCVHFRLLGVYKEGQAAYWAIQVRVS